MTTIFNRHPTREPEDIVTLSEGVTAYMSGVPEKKEAGKIFLSNRLLSNNPLLKEEAEARLAKFGILEQIQAK